MFCMYEEVNEKRTVPRQNTIIIGSMIDENGYHEVKKKKKAHLYIMNKLIYGRHHKLGKNIY